MSQEFIPVYPTMAFATRRDHEIWIEENAAREAREAAVVVVDPAIPGADETAEQDVEIPAKPEAPAPSSRRKRSAPAEPEAPAPVAAE